MDQPPKSDNSPIVLVRKILARMQSKFARLIRSLLTARPSRGLAQCQSGSTIVEFALVATPFFALLVAILETALVFMAQQVLQTATTQSARLIMTGQAQTQNMSATQFQQ